MIRMPTSFSAVRCTKITIANLIGPSAVRELVKSKSIRGLHQNSESSSKFRRRFIFLFWRFLPD